MTTTPPSTAPPTEPLPPPDAAVALAAGLDAWASLLDAQGRILWSAEHPLRRAAGAADARPGTPWHEALGLQEAQPLDLDGRPLRLALQAAIEQGTRWMAQAAATPTDRPTWALRTAAEDRPLAHPMAGWRLRLLPTGDGRLWALADDASEVRTLRTRIREETEILDAVRRFGRVGVWQREIPSGRGHWDDTVFRLFGFDPRGGTPDFQQAVDRVNPEDRLIESFNESTRRVGDYQARYRVMLPDASQRVVRSQWTVLPGADGQPRRIIGVMSDETELEGLSRSFGVMTEQLRLAVQMAAVGLWVHDLATDRMHYNDELFRLMGREPQPQGLSLAEVRDIIHPDDLELVQDSAVRALQTPEPVDFEARYRRTDGRWRHVLSRRVVRRDDAGRPVAFLGVSMDVTDRFDERLRTQDLVTRLDQIVDTAGVGTWRRDLVSDEAQWNPRMFRIYGVDARDGPLSRAAWLDRVHPEDRSTALGAMQRARAHPGLSQESKFRIRWPGGEVRWLEQRATCTVGAAGSAALSGITMDVTERTRTEAALRSANDRAALSARSAGMGTWSVDHASAEAFWDEQMFRLRGLPPAPTAPDRLARLAFVHPEDRTLFMGAEGRVDSTVAEGQTYEFRVVWPDGQVRWLASRSHRVLDEQGRPLSSVGVNWDVTERRMAERVREERESALRASRAKSEFLARMSHELRTPLNAVLGFTQLLREELAGSPASQRMKLDHIHDAGEHLLALINDVLALTHVETGSLSLDIQPLELDAAIAQSLPLVQTLAARRGVELLAPATGLWLRADSMRLRQVLVNVLSNAVKYNRPRGKVRVTASMDAGSVRVCVADEGPGIAPEQRQHLFEPFNRLGQQAHGIEGTGIGLVIVKALCEAMGGQVEVLSPPGGGTSVQVSLPGAAAAAAPSSVEPAPRGGPVASARSDAKPGSRAPLRMAGTRSARTGPGTVLYIEDNPVNVLLVRELIETQTALTLTVATHGAEGLARAASERPDLVLVDMQLPDMNGHQVLERLRQDPATAALRCVALSANAMREDIDQALAAGFEDYWTKPIDFGTFLRSLSERFPPG